MDPAYTDRKIVDLTEEELITLGFLGENVAPGLKIMVEKVRADPEHLGSVTCFMADCARRQYARQATTKDSTQPPDSSASPATSKADTLQLQLSNYTVVAPNLISEYEKNFWYHGLSDNPPPLLWRSDLESNPFPTPPPGARFFKVPTKTAHGVFRTPLNDVWDTVAPRILALLRSQGIKFSALQKVRFSTLEDDNDEETFGPIVVWIAVRPGTTTAAAVRDATPDILRILSEAQITGVVVEWYEASVERL